LFEPYPFGAGLPGTWHDTIVGNMTLQVKAPQQVPVLRQVSPAPATPRHTVSFFEKSCFVPAGHAFESVLHVGRFLQHVACVHEVSSVVHLRAVPSAASFAVCLTASQMVSLQTARGKVHLFTSNGLLNEHFVLWQ
jgi:hypothetical protein